MSENVDERDWIWLPPEQIAELQIEHSRALRQLIDNLFLSRTPSPVHDELAPDRG